MTKHLLPLTALLSLGLYTVPILASRADAPAPAVSPAPADFALLQKALAPMGNASGLKLSIGRGSLPDSSGRWIARHLSEDDKSLPQN